MNILVVDDDHGTLNALKVGLTSLGHDVVTAKSGREALHIIKASLDGAGLIELLLTDLKMPKMNGLEVILAARELMPGLKAILMTAYGDDYVFNQIAKLDRCAYLDKPFRPEAVMEIIEETNHVK